MKYLLLLLLTGCHLDDLLRTPEPPKPCYLDAYWVRTITAQSGDSALVSRDTVWLGATEVACPQHK